jgi:hypothetical protein
MNGDGIFYFHFLRISRSDNLASCVGISIFLDLAIWLLA